MSASSLYILLNLAWLKSLGLNGFQLFLTPSGWFLGLGLFQNMFHNPLIYNNNFCFGFITVSCFFETFLGGWLGVAGWRDQKHLKPFSQSWKTYAVQNFWICSPKISQQNVINPLLACLFFIHILLVIVYITPWRMVRSICATLCDNLTVTRGIPTAMYLTILLIQQMNHSLLR